jgi:hypothetical protein
MSDHPDTLQTFIQINVYRFRYGQFEYLLLKRIDEDDHFWQPITEHVAGDSDIAAGLKRAAVEQAGLYGFKRLDQEMYTYEWFAGNQRGRDVVFSAEVAADTPVEVDSQQYGGFKWLPFQEAVLHFKWDGNKVALRQLNERLMARKVSDPNYWRSPEQGLYVAGQKQPSQAASSEGKAQAIPAPTAANSPADGPLLPPSATVNQPSKRLPDRPHDSHESKGDDEDVNTGEWFL